MHGAPAIGSGGSPALSFFALSSDSAIAREGGRYCRGREGGSGGRRRRRRGSFRPQAKRTTVVTEFPKQFTIQEAAPFVSGAEQSCLGKNVIFEANVFLDNLYPKSPPFSHGGMSSPPRLTQFDREKGTERRRRQRRKKRRERIPLLLFSGSINRETNTLLPPPPRGKGFFPIPCISGRECVGAFLCSFVLHYASSSAFSAAFS